MVYSIAEKSNMIIRGPTTSPSKSSHRPVGLCFIPAWNGSLQSVLSKILCSWSSIPSSAFLSRMGCLEINIYLQQEINEEMAFWEWNAFCLFNHLFSKDILQSCLHCCMCYPRGLRSVLPPDKTSDDFLRHPWLKRINMILFPVTSTIFLAPSSEWAVLFTKCLAKCSQRLQGNVWISEEMSPYITLMAGTPGTPGVKKYGTSLLYHHDISLNLGSHLCSVISTPCLLPQSL